MKSMKRFIPFCLIIFCFSFLIGIQSGKTLLPHDKVYLKNGRIIEGSILDENEDFIRISIDDISEIKIPRDSIQYIKKISEQTLQKAKEFEDEQKAKGLVYYNGNWITPEEHERLSERDLLAEEIRTLREEKMRVLQQISELQGSRSFENERFRFSFNPPAGWQQVDTKTENAVCRFENSSQDAFTEYIMVVVKPKSNAVLDQAFINDTVTGMAENQQGYLTKLRGFDMIKIDALNGVKMVVSRYFFKEDDQTQEPYHQKVILYFVPGDTYLYRIECSCLIKDSILFDDVFTKSVESFVIKDRATAPTQATQIAQRTFSTGTTAPVQEPQQQPSAIAPEPLPVPEESTQEPIYQQIERISEPVEEFGVDKVFLQDGRTLSGTIMQESNDEIRIRIESPGTPEYIISVTKDTISTVEWMPESERQRKLQYEEEQRQKGLVKFYGRWITRQERSDFFRQATEEQEQMLRLKELADSQEAQDLKNEQEQATQQQQDQQTTEILAQLKQLEDEKASLMTQLEEQRDVTNQKLDEFLERERQEAPTGKIAKGTLDAIVTILSRSKYTYDDQFQASASAAIIDPDGIILSNYFIGSDPMREDWEIQLKGQDESNKLQARIIQYDPILDVAIVKVNARGLPSLPLGSAASLIQGDQIINVGAQLGYQDAYKTGRVLSLQVELVDLFDVNWKLRRNVEKKYGTLSIEDLKRRFKSDYGKIQMIQHNAITFDRNNGGPLLNKDGEVVGINQNLNIRGAVSVVLPPTTQSFNMAVSINAIKNQRKFTNYLR
ncbi:MAG: serine protease [Candidatus Auribacter fodinae]|jgi:S1-C subfamily serine protease|uniref:Serine protease n=1 Tax=Candidatus Auribacter fodinae TaxID=2093366 RepID=A0A3A4R2G2_9BACT|nr:MAG: serine protease [Candidatus Auribacter fodinae]